MNWILNYVKDPRHSPSVCHWIKEQTNLLNQLQLNSTL